MVASLLARLPLLVSLLAFPAHAADMETPTALTRRLLESYGSKSVRPSVAAAEAASDAGQCMAGVPPPDEVSTQIYVEDFSPIDMRKQQYGLVGYLRAYWSDARLRFNGTTSGGCVDKLSLSTTEIAQIWRPLFYWEGAKQITFPDTERDGTGELLEVYPDGSVWWSRQVTMELKCPVGKNLANMPFDTQR